MQPSYLWHPDPLVDDVSMEHVEGGVVSWILVALLLEMLQVVRAVRETSAEFSTMGTPKCLSPRRDLSSSILC